MAMGDLALGPLAELLVLRRTWKRSGMVAPVTASDPRSELLRSCLGARECRLIEQPGIGLLRTTSDQAMADDAAVGGLTLALNKALRSGAMPTQSIQALAGVTAELIDNIGEHADHPPDSFAAFQVGDGDVWLTVADAGQGVLAGYQNFAGVDQPEDAQQALEWAILEHRSRTRKPHRGLGYKKIQRALRSMDASIRVRSDDASLEVTGVADAASWLLREQVHLSGFVVSIHVSWRT